MYFNKYDKTAMSLTGQIVAMKMYYDNIHYLADSSINITTCI